MNGSMLSVETCLQCSVWLPRVVEKFPQLLQQPDGLAPLTAQQLYQQIYDDCVAASNEVDLFKRLRQQRYQQLARLAIRDFQSVADVRETLVGISTVADALINASLDWHMARFERKYGVPMGRESGEPQRLLVLGMGKQGGQELNFSSDIDLIFLYGENGETDITGTEARKSISNEVFFTRLGQALNKSLADMTEDGFAYRVDMRLRPFGDAGPLVTTLTGLDIYLQNHGRDWERYALVKGRLLTGTASDRQAYREIVEPFLYRQYIDFTALDAIRQLKAMIVAEYDSPQFQRHIKLGPGGIRELEFLVQVNQLIYASKHRQLKQPSWYEALNLLTEQGVFTPEEAQQMLQAYEFLRRVENALQAWNDQQTHHLPAHEPDNETQLQALVTITQSDSIVAFETTLQSHRDLVSGLFQRLFAEQDSVVMGEAQKLWLLSGQVDWVDSLTEAKLPDQQQAVAKLLVKWQGSSSIRRMSAEAKSRLDAVMPLLLEEVLALSEPMKTLQRLLKVLDAVVRRSVYLVFLKENPHSLGLLVQLCAASDWLANQLAQSPALFYTLLDETHLYAPMQLDELTAQAMGICQDHVTDERLDEAQFMYHIRQWKNEQVFKISCGDIENKLNLTEVSDALTWVAQAAMNSVLQFAWQWMKQKNGMPSGWTDEDQAPLLMLAYGKFGGEELGYSSDLDVVFLSHGIDPHGELMRPSGNPMDHSVYMIRLAQKVSTLCTTLLSNGRLYEVDTRLRPNGASGLACTDFASYQQYIENRAWMWEHQALVRARTVLGTSTALAAFTTFRQNFLRRQRDRQTVKTDVVEMRQKMRDALDKSNESRFDIKHGIGGVVDVEFLVQCLVLSHASEHRELTESSATLILLKRLQETGVLEPGAVAVCQAAFVAYRHHYHRKSIADLPGFLTADELWQQRQQVADVWQSIME